MLLPCNMTTWSHSVHTFYTDFPAVIKFLAYAIGSLLFLDICADIKVKFQVSFAEILSQAHSYACVHCRFINTSILLRGL